MKAIKILMIAGALAVAAPAFAQFSNASTGANGGSSMVKDCTPYDRISLSYQYDKLSPDYKGADDQGLNGIAIDYLHGFSLSKTLPIFLETGIGANFGFYSDVIDPDFLECGELKSKMTTISLSIPVNVAYKFNVNSDFSIQPYLGLNLKFNVFAQSKQSASIDDEEYFENRFGEDYDLDRYEEKYNMFDKDDVGKDGQWKRFQLGWHIGVGATYKAFYLGLSYGTDFMELAKKLNTSTFKIGVGYNF